MPYSPETYRLEQLLFEGSRSGDFTGIKTVPKKYLKQYHRFVKNNFFNTIEQAFPIAIKVVPEKNLNILMNDFITCHRAITPFVWKLPFEFYTFVKQNQYDKSLNLPWLNDLLLFEWLEIEIFTAPDLQVQPSVAGKCLINSIAVINPVNKLVKLTYPVHLFSVKESVAHKGDYFLLTYRNRQNIVKYIDLSPLHAFFLENLSRNLTGYEILDKIKKLSPEKTNIDTVEKNLTDFLNQMLVQEVILGHTFRQNNN